ncbi:CLUMA_CG015399, isoform A [Clunio marinus]|uniref:CLUMA_CG015399, isoform A n=1 Tax=Clunio marinus TaxID=568069 RepID=A0A1J1IS63_9DIPT|nr:CLUMA_CG015399, isoform A [Clunio marinus]
MNFIKNALFYLLLQIFEVKTIGSAENLEQCVTKVGSSLSDSYESTKNLLKLIDQSSVILKAFCSGNLMNIADSSSNDDEKTRELKESEKSFELENDDYYDDYYFYKNGGEEKLKLLMTFTPITIFKGTSILRELESFNTQEYFLIKGQLNATLVLGQSDKIQYQKKCYSNQSINEQLQILNENHLIERQIRTVVPGQLILFGKLDQKNGQSRQRLVAKTSGIVRWNSHLENFIWNNLGWSSWGKWSPCSSSCKGIQQRYRHCLKKKQNKSNEEMSDENDYESAGSRNAIQHLCNGYNIEQRDCNLFECKDAVNLLSLVNDTKLNMAAISAHINQAFFGKDFTIMFTIRAKVNRHMQIYDNEHLISFRSSSNEHSSLTITLIDTGIKVVQEKDGTSEMFDIKLKFFDLHWHQIAFSFRNDGLITCFVDCNWDSSFIMAKGSFEVPPDVRIEMNSKLRDLIEWKQLSLVLGNHERAQCSSERKLIFDNNKLLEKLFNDEAN